MYRCWCDLKSSHGTYHVRLPQRFTHPVHLLRTGAAHNKVFCLHGAADQIQGADERLKGFGIKSGDHRLNVVRPEPNKRITLTRSLFTPRVSIYSSSLFYVCRDGAHLLSYNRLDTMLMKVLGLIWRPSFSSYRFSRNLSLWDLHTSSDIQLPQQKYTVNSLRYVGVNAHLHCLNISGQSSQSYVQPFSHGENLLEVCGNHLSLDAKPPVSCYRYTVLPPHGHDGPSIIGHNRLEERQRGERKGN